jgi:hypothetical protein
LIRSQLLYPLSYGRRPSTFANLKTIPAVSPSR